MGFPIVNNPAIGVRSFFHNCSDWGLAFPVIDFGKSVFILTKEVWKSKLCCDL